MSSQHVIDEALQWLPLVKELTDTELEDKDKEREHAQAAAKRGPAYTKRVITHTSFHNIGFKVSSHWLTFKILISEWSIS